MNQNVVKCRKCGTDNPMPPPIAAPLIANGPGVSCIAFLNVRFKCINCGTQHVTAVEGAQLNITWLEVPEESRILVPSMIPPRIN